MEIDTFIQNELSVFLKESPENHLTEKALNDLTKIVSLLVQKVDSLKDKIDDFVINIQDDVKENRKLQKSIKQLRTEIYTIIYQVDIL